jgi:hypothetical protein
LDDDDIIYREWYIGPAFQGNRREYQE